MRIQQTSRLITACVIVLAIASVACAVVSLRLRNRQIELYQIRVESSRMAEQLAGGSERLTAAIRGYAATGDRRYYDAFQRELVTDRTRDRAMERLQQLGLTRDELELLRAAKANSDALVSLENRAMAAVARRQLAEAIGLVFGDDYNRAKASILEPIQEARNRMERRLTAEALQVATQARQIAHLVLGMLGLTLALVLGSVLFFYDRQVVRPLLSLNQTLRDLLERRPGARIGFQDRKSEVGELARSMERYHRAAVDAERERWVKVQEAEIDRALHGVEQVGEFANRLLARLVPAMGGGWAALHVLDAADGTFRAAGGFGLPPGTPLRAFKPGVTLAGQAATGSRLLVVNPVPADYLPIVSGLGSAVPSTLVLAPVAAEDVVLAVIEVALPGEISGQGRELLEAVAGMVALKLQVLLRNQSTRQLLEQVQATEAAVRAGQEQLRTLVDSIRSVIFMKDRDGRHLLVNRYYEEATGIRRDTLLGKTDQEVMPAETAEAIMAADRRIMDSGEPSTYEEIVPRPDGTNCHYLTTKVPLRHENGEVYGICGIATDITGQKRTEEALKQANRLADIALDLTRCGYWKVDYSDPDFYWQSERAARILGETVKPDGRYHLQHEWFARLVEASPEAAQETAQRYQASIEGRTGQYDATYPYRRPSDGKIVWVHASGFLERAPDGTARAMYGVYQDITESHAAETRLRENERRLRDTEQFFRSVLELAPDGLMVVDQDGRITLANARCEEVFGYPREELIGLSVEALVPDSVRARHPGLRAGFHAAPSARELGAGRRLQARRKDGSVVAVEIGLSPLPQREGYRAEVAVSIRAPRPTVAEVSGGSQHHGP